MEEVDSRFLHLLQPIRDLTKNWEVDVAAQLGEYLEELEHICISFDNGKTTMNFMEAALLIQGSACIYSKKVEYLYMLVCQTLDCISNKKREKLPTSLGPDGRDADATFTDREEEFLSLDDIPETSQASVDMRRDQQPAAVNIVPLTPMSLVPPEEGEKKENPLLSRRGEVLASRRDFRMNTSTPHASGAFLLELAGLSPTHPQQEQHLGTATGTWGPLGCHCHCHCQELTCPCPPAAAPESAGCDTAPVQALSFSEETGEGGTCHGVSCVPPGCSGGRWQCRECLDLSSEGFSIPTIPCSCLSAAPRSWQERLLGGFLDRQGGNGVSWKLLQPLPVPTPPGAAGPDDDDVPGVLRDDMEVTPVPSEHIQAQRSTPRTRGYILRERPPSQDPKPHSKEEPNLWQSLDPFGDSEEKPFRKGRPFLVPHGLEDTAGGKRKRTGPRKLQDFIRWFSAVDTTTMEGRKSRRKGPTFADLEVLYWRQFKERMAAHRKLQSRGEPLWEPEQERGANGEEGADDDFVEHEDVEHEDAEPEVLEELGEGSLEPPEPGYEELVRRNVELFMASSQKFAQETELSQRIRLWEERMEPLLQEQAGTEFCLPLHVHGYRLALAVSLPVTRCPQESRAPFSVRAYGQSLVQRCSEPGRWHSLASLVAGQLPFEVCRYLLASLQLANDGEVELAQEAGLEAALDTARLRLLSARPAHERFENFQLPSQRDPGPK
ncbi:condensin-2 complex subunit H2 [Sylvia borin]